MQTKLLQLASSALGRPLLMERGAISFWADKIRASEPQIFKRPGRFAVMARKLVGKVGSALAMDEDDYVIEVPFEKQLAYCPRYIGEPDDAGFCWTLKNGVALLSIEGPLLDEGCCCWGDAYHGYDTLLAALQEAHADPRVGAIFLKINSPGGYATGGIITLAKWMRENRAAAGGKPIHVYAKMACSAAQWTAAQGDKIWCPEMAYVGSIGAYCIHCDLSGLYEKEGIKITDYSMWEDKTDGADWKPMSEGGAADAMADIGQIVQLFAADMIAGRPQLTFDALKTMRSRAFFSRHSDPTRSGIALGLVDEIASEEVAFRALAATISVPAGTGTALATRAGRAADPKKEKPMAVKTGLAAQRAALMTTVASLTAQLAKIDAEIKEDPEKCADPAEDPENPENPEDPQTDPKPEDPEEGEEEAKAIAASAEGKENPALALASIEQGLSFAQFKAMAGCSTASGGRGRLARVMADSPRLGPDAPEPQSAVSDLNPAKIYAARRDAARR
jgi:capsid assembly protease